MRPIEKPSVLFHDEHLLVVCKPAGLPTTAPNDEPSLTEWARTADPRAPHLHPTSRLDAEVTGIVTFARTRRGNKSLLLARRQGNYRRHYLGIAQTPPQPAAGLWSGDIGIDVTDRRRRRVSERANDVLGVRAASTSYCVTARAAGCALVVMAPHTGRTHQLRVHAAHAGAPLLGDRRYGGSRRTVMADGRVVNAGRVMLHCARLNIPAIDRDAILDLRAEPSQDFVETWCGLGGDAADLVAAIDLPMDGSIFRETI